MVSVKTMTDLSDRVAVVTGGAGHVGRSVCYALAELGCRVVMVDKTEIDVQQHAQIESFGINLECEIERIELASKICDQFRRIDILINNAAFVGESSLSGWTTSFKNQSVDTWRRALEVNLTAPFHLCQLFAEHLKASGNGAIINVGSIYGVLGPDMSLYEGTEMGNPAAYAASKGGLLQLTRWLSTTLAPEVRVNSVCPGGIGRGQEKRFVDRYVKRTPLGRMGTEDDIVGAIIYLATDQSRWVTGQNIMVDGGWSAW